VIGFQRRGIKQDSSLQVYTLPLESCQAFHMVLTSAALLPTSLLRAYWGMSPRMVAARAFVDARMNCEDILMNFIVSHVTRRPPIKVTQRRAYKETSGGLMRPPWSDQEHFMQRHSCLNTFAAVFGYMPLLRSATRLDPVLYRDPVAVWRKRYSRLETVPAAG